MRPPRSRSPPTRIYMHSRVLMFYGLRRAARSSGYRTIGAIGGIINYRVNTSVKRSTFLYIFFPVYESNFRRLRAAVCREDESLLGLSSARLSLLLSARLSLIVSPPLPFHLSLIERLFDPCFDRYLREKHLSLRCALPTRHPVRQCSEYGGVMREFGLYYVRSLRKAALRFARARYTDADIYI